MSFFVAGSILVGGAVASDQAGDAADDATAASSAALAEQRRQFDTVRDDTRIMRRTGNDALMTLGFLLGVRAPPNEEKIKGIEDQLAKAQAKREQAKGEYGSLTPFQQKIKGGPDVSGIDNEIDNLKQKLRDTQKEFEISKRYEGGLGEYIKRQPGYELGLTEGRNAVGNALTAQGQSQGGKAAKALTRFGQDYAESKVDSHLNKVFTLAGYGPTGVSTSANAGQNYANAAGQHAGVVGDAAFGRAGANIGAVNNALNTGVSLYTYNDYMNRTRPGTP